MKKLFFLISMLFFALGSVPANAVVCNGDGCVFETHTTNHYETWSASALAENGASFTEAIGNAVVDAENTVRSSYYYYGYSWAEGSADASAYLNDYGDYVDTSGSAYARGRGHAYGWAEDYYSGCGPQESTSRVIVDREASVFSYAQKGDAEAGAVAFSDTKATMRDEYEQVSFGDNYAYSGVDSYNYYYYYNDGYASASAHARRDSSGYVYASTSGYSQVPYYYYNNTNLVSREHLATGTGTAAVWVTNGGVRGESSATYSYSGNYYGSGSAWASGSPGCGGGVSVSAGSSGYAYSYTQGYVQQGNPTY